VKSERDQFRDLTVDDESDDIEILEIVGLDEPARPSKARSGEDEPARPLIVTDDDPVTEDDAVTDRDRLIRLYADFENYKKRIQREQDEAERLSAARVMKSLLPVLDNFERAIGSANESGTQDPLLKGVELIFRQLLEAMRREGVEAIDTVGEMFDPEYHEAVATTENSGFPSHTVIEEMQRGYKLHDQVIRPSLVRVAVEIDEPDSREGEGS